MGAASRRGAAPEGAAGRGPWADFGFAVTAGATSTAKVTSVIFAGDPVAPREFTQEATAQEYFPEWVLAGSGLVDNNVFARTPKDRAGVRDALARTSGFQGVTGVMSFDEHGELRKPLYVLTIRDREIRLWTPPEEPPQG